MRNSIGCSSFDEGFTSVVATDYSEEVITKMIHKHANKKPHLSFMVMDCLSMSCPSSSIDVILDKGESRILILLDLCHFCVFF